MKMIDRHNTLVRYLKERQDQAALEQIKAYPALITNEIIGLTLDYRCLKTIAYLRQLDVITLAGRTEREAFRHSELNEHLRALERLIGEIDWSIFDDHKRRNRHEQF